MTRKDLTCGVVIVLNEARIVAMRDLSHSVRWSGQLMVSLVSHRWELSQLPTCSEKRSLWSERHNQSCHRADCYRTGNSNENLVFAC